MFNLICICLWILYTYVFNLIHSIIYFYERFVSKRNDLFYIVYIVNVFWLFVFNLLSYVELFLPVKLFVVYIKFKKCILLLKNFLISLAPKVLQLLFSFALNFPIIFQILHLITFDSS